MEIKQIGSTIEGKYKEPTTNDDGSPLNDLTKVNIRVANTSDLTKTIAEVDVPASAATGGAEKTFSLNVPVEGGKVADLTIIGVAIDDNGNKSKEKTATLVIDTLAPAPIE